MYHHTNEFDSFSLSMLFAVVIFFLFFAELGLWHLHSKELKQLTIISKFSAITRKIVNALLPVAFSYSKTLLKLPVKNNLTTIQFYKSQ